MPRSFARSAMDTNLQILTTDEHVLKPIEPGKYHPGEMCVTLSKWGISNIGTIQPGFHVAYMRLADIHARPMPSAPTGAKLLLYSRYGCWLIGTVTQNSREHYAAWAPLPKVAPEVNRYKLAEEEMHPMVQEGVKLFAKMVEFAYQAEARLLAKIRLSVVRTLLVDAVNRPVGDLVGLHSLSGLIARQGETLQETMARLMDVLPYLTGARGPYDLYFFHGDEEVTVTAEKGQFHASTSTGKQLGESEIMVACRRRAF